MVLLFLKNALSHFSRVLTQPFCVVNYSFSRAEINLGLSIFWKNQKIPQSMILRPSFGKNAYLWSDSGGQKLLQKKPKNKCGQFCGSAFVYKMKSANMFTNRTRRHEMRPSEKKWLTNNTGPENVSLILQTNDTHSYIKIEKKENDLDYSVILSSRCHETKRHLIFSDGDTKVLCLVSRWSDKPDWSMWEV